MKNVEAAGGSINMLVFLALMFSPAMYKRYMLSVNTFASFPSIIIHDRKAVVVLCSAFDALLKDPGSVSSIYM